MGLFVSPFSSGLYATNLLLPRLCLFGIEGRKGYFSSNLRVGLEINEIK